jgi:hypothetical protein
MEQADITRACEVLRQRGEPISARRIRKVLIELGQSGGSYRDIYFWLASVGETVITEADEAAIAATDPDDGGDMCGGERHLRAGDVGDIVQEHDFDPEPPDDEDESETELPPAAELIAQAEARLAQAQVRVQQLAAAQPARQEAIDAAREQVLGSVQRQLAGKECRWRGYWPAEDEGQLQALQDEVQAKARAYRETRQAAEQLTQSLAAARQAVYQASRALEAVQREAAIREHAPELWSRLQRALRARDRDPLVTGPDRYDSPGDSLRAKARHEQAMAHIEAEIAGVLQTAGVASGEWYGDL